MSSDSKPIDADVLVVPDTEHDRYATFGFLAWWDQRRVREATILVVGAGALGNEVLKNLALTGVGRLLIVDYDTVDASNLSRSVLFRDRDRGRQKARAAAEAVRRLNPDVEAGWLHADVTQALGSGAFRHADVVIGCLDNRETRLHLNRACFQVGKPWVDGALHEMLGEARVFWPGRGACYECTLGAADYEAMGVRYGCVSLARDLVLEGKIATTSTIASIIGGIQAQDALKMLHGIEVKPGTGLVFNGLTNDAYTVTYPFHADCFSHQILEPIIDCPDLSAEGTTVAAMLARVWQSMGEDAVLELGFDLLVRFECSRGDPPEEVLQPTSRVKESAARCPGCGSLRWPRQVHSIVGSEQFLKRTLVEIGVPPLAILCGRSGENCRFFELTGDRPLVFDRNPESEGDTSHG